MRFEILGCSGGIGGKLQTTAFLVDDDILIDGGTGLTGLELERLAKIDHVFVTHAHLDHIAGIPLMVDSCAHMRSRPLTIYALEAVISCLESHVFNWKIWPDFSRIPTPDAAFMRYRPIYFGDPVRLGSRTITPIPAKHVVPTAGFHLDSGAASLVFSADTTANEALWNYVNGIENLRYLLIETAFPNDCKEIALLSKHLYPDLLAEELRNLRVPAEIYITHLKPDSADQTMREIRECVKDWQPRMLENGQVFNL